MHSFGYVLKYDLFEHTIYVLFYLDHWKHQVSVPVQITYDSVFADSEAQQHERPSKPEVENKDAPTQRCFAAKLRKCIRTQTAVIILEINVDVYAQVEQSIFKTKLLHRTLIQALS